MKMKRLVWLVCSMLVVIGSLTGVRAEETKEQKDARMAWWREAKFGMFIHWGVYAVPAGTWDGKQIPGIGEWIMNRGKIPCADYQAFAKQFNPVKYNADAWVQLAKEAGMKYMVITSKHHDGFALFDSKVTGWDVVDASPYGKDLLKPLAEACRKHGIKLGFYYSQAQDWNHKGGAGNSWDPSHKGSMDEYIDKIAVPQVKEILSNYGEFPVVLWWDTPRDMNPERAAKLHKVVEELRPNIILNNRLGGGFKGDTETPEQHIPAGGYKDRDWETCMTMNDTWGYKSYDNKWKSNETLLFNLVDIVSKGGNYLLNVGPTAEGLIPPPSVERLKAVGAWMKVNGESIYGASPTCFGAEYGTGAKSKDGYGKERETNTGREWRCTRKGNKLYLHLFKWPANGVFDVPAKLDVVKASLLADAGKALETSVTGLHTKIKLPANAPDKIASVICVEINGTPEVDPSGKAPPEPKKTEAKKAEKKK